MLLTSEGPVWVTGRRPAGKGFQLDPAYRADTARWLEVSGKVQVAGEVSYLKAGKVALIARPEDRAGAVPALSDAFAARVVPLLRRRPRGPALALPGPDPLPGGHAQSFRS